MTKTYFITGTDTEVGKTYVSCALLEAFKQQGCKTLAMKPVAAGCFETEHGLRNEDALALQESMTEALDYDLLNPVALKSAIAPHIAAAQEGKRPTVSRLAGFCRGVMNRGADLLLIEGAGGWRVPLNERETLADLARVLELPVILVVGIRLGCINHALLSAQAINADGLRLAGWVANIIEPRTSCIDENINTLKGALQAPCLGVVPFAEEANPRHSAQYLQTGML